ncbi:uncharacterized protein LOC143510883 isoform X1 [Brachyhypopomus gauderio]|uniref:uncharacterized protein LOC143510883 isoform X1 n=1 Tax=Brachyhypopomus gauderio TaxID=698409 RepID=UPI00404307A4
MEESESSLTRIGRTVWTVWGYLTGAVGRYLRPEVTNEPNPNTHSEREPVIGTINKSYRELKEKEEEIERSETKTWNQHERKMREVAGLQHSGVRVRTAAAQWEVSMKGHAGGDGDHDEDSGTSKHTCSSTARSTEDRSSENAERRVEELRCNETLDYNVNINHEAKIILSTDLVKQDHEVSPSVITNVNTECQECEGSGGENPGVDANVLGNNPEQRGNSEKEISDYMRECVVGGIERTDGEDVDQGFEHEQVNGCHKGDKEYTNEASVENAIDYANNQYKNVEKSNNEDKNHKSQMEDEDLSLLIHPKSDTGNLLNTPTNKEVIYKEEVSTNKAESQAITNMETEQATMGKIKLGQVKDLTASVAQQLCKFTGTEIFDKQEVYGSKKHEAETEHNDNKIEVACELMEFGAAQMENADINTKETEPCSNMGLKKATLQTFADITSGLDTNTMETVQLKQLKEDIEVTNLSETTLKTEVMQLEDTDCISGSQRLEVGIIQSIESVIATTEVEAGHQNQTEDLKSKCKQDTKAEVSSEDVMKSAMVETILHEHFTDREETIQETVYQCSLEQDPGKEEPANGKINESGLLEAPFSEMLKDLRGPECNFVGQPDETAIKSTDEMLSPSLQELDKTQCSVEMSVGSTTELIVETKTVSIEQKLLLVKHNEVADACKPVTTEEKGQQAEFETDTSKTESESFIATTEATSETSAKAQAPVLHDMSKTLNILRDEQNYSECMAQDKSSKTESYGSKHGSSETLDLPDWESPLKTLEMWRNSQKDLEEDSTMETTSGLPYEIKAMEVLEEVMSGLTKESIEMQSDLSRQIESPDDRITETECEMIELLNDIEEYMKDLQGETVDTGSEACRQFEVEKMAQYTSCEIELNVQLTEEGKSNMPHKQASVSDTTLLDKKDHEDKVDDNNENFQKRNRPGLKRGFEKIERGEEKEEPSESKDWAVTDLLFAQVSTLDFTAQKSKIAVKNPLIRPPKDPRTLINMTSVEPLTPPCPPGPRPLRKSPTEGVSPGKGVLGFKLPGLGSGLPALRQTEAGRKMKHGEEAQCVTSQKFGTDPAECYAKQDKLHDKPKSTPARHPGMGNQQMMLELKNKLKKNKNEKE